MTDPGSWQVQGIIRRPRRDRGVSTFDTWEAAATGTAGADRFCPGGADSAAFESFFASFCRLLFPGLPVLGEQALGARIMGATVKLKDKWRIVAMPDYEAYFPDMSEPTYILFDGEGGGEFAFGCVTGSIYEAGGTNAVEFIWDGNDEMDEASGAGWAELQPDGSIKAKSASTAATKRTSSPGLGRLLQQPARALPAGLLAA